MRLTRDEAAALETLAREGHGHATTGEAPDELHPSWVKHLDRLAELDFVDAYPENGTLASDPGRTFYELTDKGADVLVAIREARRNAW